MSMVRPYNKILRRRNQFSPPPFCTSFVIKKSGMKAAISAEVPAGIALRF